MADCCDVNSMDVDASGDVPGKKSCGEDAEHAEEKSFESGDIGVEHEPGEGASDEHDEGDGYDDPSNPHDNKDDESGGNDVSMNGRKRRHRRGKNKGGKRHRPWKPYNKLTWEERKVVDERETRRACQRREQRFASGQPMAPYNTTQFLMEQHQPDDAELDLDKPGPRTRPGGAHPRPQGSGSGGSADSSGEEDFYESPNDEDIFMEKEFTETYENCHAERLQNMSKEELIKEYLELETKMETMEKRLHQIDGENNVANNNTTRNSVELTNVGSSAKSDLEDEIRRLRAENHKLSEENSQLRTVVAKDVVVTDIEK